MGRQRFSREFRESAVRLVEEEGRSVADVARGLGVQASTLRYWVKTRRERGGAGSPAEEASLHDRVRRLEAENQQLKMEREILEKAAAFFAREQP